MKKDTNIPIKRRKTPTVQIGPIRMGSGYPIVIQSMTNTQTANIKATVKQIKELADAGSELVRITINNDNAMRVVPQIIGNLRKSGYTAPIIGDFHYNGHLLLRKYPQSAKLLDKYRINPGNVGRGEQLQRNFTEIITIAKKYNKAVRIGANWGSLDQNLLSQLMDKNAQFKNPKDSKEIIYEAMIQSVLKSAQWAIQSGLKKTKLVLSVKMSDVQDTIEVYSRLAKRCDYALHLGLTEAGVGERGITASTAALAVLLQRGIGDTIRVSLTPQKGIKRSLEVEICKALLQSMGLRYFSPHVTSCPGCGRTDSDHFQSLAEDIHVHIKKKLPSWKKQYPGIEKLTIAVMGCVVNGPGESRHADIGISLPGTSEKPMAPVFINGKKKCVLSGKRIKKDFLEILEDTIKGRFKKKRKGSRA